jgi:hypothetical protein
MRVLRVLALSVMLSACGAPVLAQSSALQTPGFQLSPVVPQAGLAGRSLPAIANAQTVAPHLLAQADSGGTCYAMRTYTFARGSSEADMTKPTGYSTCQPSKQIKMRSTAAPKARLIR